MKSPKEIELLVSRYYDGLTSREEETELRSFVTGPDCPAGPEWDALKAIMGYEKALGAPRVVCRKKPLRLIPWRWVSVAAVAVILLTLALPGMLSETKSDVAWVDGQKLTGRQEVAREAVMALDLVRTNDGDPLEALREMNN